MAPDDEFGVRRFRFGACAACAEAAGTALLVLLTCLLAGTCAPGGGDPPGSEDPRGGGDVHAGALRQALAAGAIVTLLVQCFDRMSGALLNPAVTAAALVRGRLRAGAAAAAGAAQLAGGVAGAALLTVLAPKGAVQACVTRPAPGLSPIKAAAVEAILGACLSLANCAWWEREGEGGAWPLRIGACVAALTLAAGAVSGASMNPARSLAPALLAGDTSYLWVYCAGPVLGAACAAALHRALAPARAPARAPAPLMRAT